MGICWFGSSSFFRASNALSVSLIVFTSRVACSMAATRGADYAAQELTALVEMGQVVVHDVLGLGVDVIATRSVPKA